MTTAELSTIDQFELPHPNGHDQYRISVARPAHADPAARQSSVLFVLDGDLNFGIATELARFRAYLNLPGSVIVVGVGYGADMLELMSRRSADLTLPLSEEGKKEISTALQGMPGPYGGAEATIDFLIGDLIPEIMRRYPEASPDKNILFGHSLGGLVAALALLTRTDAFSTYIIVSPALFWDRFAILEHLDAFAERAPSLTKQPKVLVSAASRESQAPYKVPPEWGMTREQLVAVLAPARMVAAAAEFAEALREIGLRHVQHLVCQDEGHMTTIPAAMTRGLSFALEAPI